VKPEYHSGPGWPPDEETSPIDAIELLRSRPAAVTVSLVEQVAEVDGMDVVAPAAPGTSPIAPSLWHVPRAQDWLVSTCLRGSPEVADRFGEGLPAHLLPPLAAGSDRLTLKVERGPAVPPTPRRRRDEERRGVAGDGAVVTGSNAGDQGGGSALRALETYGRIPVVALAPVVAPAPGA
jgi:hypothetical protein